MKTTAEAVRSPGYRGCPFRNYLAEVADHDDAAGRIATAYLRDTRAQIDRLVAELHVTDQELLAEQIWLVVEGLHAAAAHPGGERAADVAVSLVEHLLAHATAHVPE